MTDRTPIVMLDPEALEPGQYVLTVESVGAETRFGLDPLDTTPTTVLVPWTTTTASGPELMWDDDDNLMMIEVPR